MSTKKLGWFLISILVLLFMAGCRCENSVIPTFYGIADAPADGEITSLNPSFDWHGSDSCEPDEYLLQVVESNSNVGGPILTNIAESALPFTYPGSAFLPGRSYTWSLKAINGATDTEPVVFGPKTEVGQFFTGPVCSGETLIAPDLRDPEPAGWVEDDPYLFNWAYTGGCLPESYQLQFALDPGFTNISMTVNTTELYAQEKLLTFLDCTSLWWRVRAFDGTSYGPWSAGQDFHYVLSAGCYQWDYESDDFAWINVRLYEDGCDQTGFMAAWTETLHPGCMVDGMYIVGDGTTYAAGLADYTVDLGSGPCPSTGLDQKTPDGPLTKFGVVTPGTYCVTISRDQIADNSGFISLMDGIWTEPRVNQILAEETIDFGPGNYDHLEVFVWDDPDRPFLIFPLNFTYPCKFGPEDICKNYDFAEKGAFIPILARDTNSDWKLTQLNGIGCYVKLGNAAINDEMAGAGIRAEDLEFFARPDPCATPEPETRKKTCSDYTTRSECGAHITDGCLWDPGSDSCVDR